MNWMDICVIIIIATNGLRGFSIGLVLAFFNIASYIAAGIIAKMYYSFLAQFIIEKTNWFSSIQQFVINNMKFLGNDNLQGQGTQSENIFEMMNLPKIFEDLFSQSYAFKDSSEGILDNINIYASQMITKTVIDLLSIILIFLIAKLLLNILGAVLNGMASLPIINQFNRLGGFIFGVLKGGIIIFILTAILVPIASIFPDSYVVRTLEASDITKIFYDYNLLLYMIRSFIGYGSDQLVNSF